MKATRNRLLGAGHGDNQDILIKDDPVVPGEEA